MPRSNPQTPQIHPQKRMPTKTQTVWIWPALLVIRGLTRSHSRLLIAIATPPTRSAIETVPN